MQQEVILVEQKLEIKLKTLTPLWTGGVEAGKMDRIHETGIIGSLRWWYEAIVRGLGGWACDPTSSKCRLSGDSLKKFEQAMVQGKSQWQALEAADICDICKIFGTTGWRRQFRITVLETQVQSDGPNKQETPSGKRYKHNSTKKPVWFFGEGKSGTFNMRFTNLNADFESSLLLGILKLIEQQAGLAAKTQLGYGLIEIKEAEVPSFEASDLTRFLTNQISSPQSPNTDLPDLCNMFFAKIQTNQTGIAPTLDLKYDIRAAFRSAFGGNQKLRHFVCGYAKQGSNDRQASKVFMSQAVNGQMRVWGWIPQQLPHGVHVTREQVIEEIQRVISTFGTLQSWREYNSPRDTLTLESDRVAFLGSLLEEETRHV
jgi:CRISPR-associated protein Cmr1